ncbi:MAG: alanine racemase [Oscillospiraceae bacterium]|nr:alanine racemase [Oscillospiraceae bacterium]
MELDNSYALVDLDAVAANFQAVAEKTGVPVMAVIKADGYGHGAVAIARRLEGICKYFGAASVQEAQELRAAGIKTPILVLGPMPPAAYETAIREHIRPVICRYEDAQALSQTALRLGVDAPFHFAVDTGMSRIGFQATEEDADICKAICALPGLIPEGLFSHYATADSADLTRAKAQAEQFAAFDRMLKARGVQVKLRHLSNSAGCMNFDGHYEMVRAGIVLYGLYPSDEVDTSRLPLRPALQWRSRISHIKTLEPGRQISYGGTFITEKTTVVATIPVGYADGYKRTLSNKFYVLIRGKKAPILGRVCMDQFMVDVTDIPNATVGDSVVLIGQDGEESISAEAFGEAAQSFNYEVICSINSRVARYYLQGGKVVASVHYLLDNRT